MKKQSELTVEEKKSTADDSADKNPDETANGDDDAGTAAESEGHVQSKTGEKRAAEDEQPEGEEAPKKMKAGRGRPKKAGAAAAPASKKAAAPEKKAEKKADSGEKKPRGRPKKEEGAAATTTPKAKKNFKQKAAPNGTGVGSRTRSNKK